MVSGLVTISIEDLAPSWEAKYKMLMHFPLNGVTYSPEHWIVKVKAMPHGSDFYNEFAKIHQIYEKSYRAMEFLNEIVIARHAQLNPFRSKSRV